MGEVGGPGVEEAKGLSLSFGKGCCLQSLLPGLLGQDFVTWPPLSAWEAEGF